MEHASENGKGPSSDFEGANTERSAEAQPTIEDERDLERVMSTNKPTAPSELSEEARKQIAPKLKPKKAA
jgi:hypothetical protein